MKIELAHSRTLLTTDDGVVHVPFTLYLNSSYDNPHTMIAAARGLRAFNRFVDAFDIDIASRALEACCLTEGEKKALYQLVFYPIEQIEAMSDRTVRLIASAQKNKDPARIRGAVEPNTAVKQLFQIADFLLWYHKKVLEPRIPLASPVTEALRRAYESCAKELKRAVASTKSSHPHRIRSVPTRRFLEVYAAVYSRPEDILLTDSGQPGSNLMRDRAMVLLAAEGIRPGAIGNIALANFKWPGGKARGHIAIKDNTSRRSKPLSAATPVQKGTRSRQNYNSEGTISIWPTTAQAVRDYIDGERQEITGRTLRNKSEGFLFLAEHGGAIGDRSTISTVFKRAGIGLQRLGLLAKDENDPYLDGEEYNFSAYLLRHSAATLFYSSKAPQLQGEVVEDLMKLRFGWSKESGMPRIYAQRAMSDAASLTVDDFLESLLADAAAAKNSTNGDSA
jgi:integrase